MNEEGKLINVNEEIDPGFNMSFLERLISFIKEILAKIFGVF